MASQTIKARDLTAGTAVKFYDGHWHRATTFTTLKKKAAPDILGVSKTLYVTDSRGWGNYFAPDQDVEVDYSL